MGSKKSKAISKGLTVLGTGRAPVLVNHRVKMNVQCGISLFAGRSLMREIASELDGYHCGFSE